MLVTLRNCWIDIGCSGQGVVFVRIQTQGIRTFSSCKTSCMCPSKQEPPLTGPQNANLHLLDFRCNDILQFKSQNASEIATNRAQNENQDGIATEVAIIQIAAN